MTTIQIAKIDSPIAELGYDGTEGYVIEIDGEYVDSDTDWAFAQAKAEQRLQAIGRLVKDEAGDYWGRQTWTMVPEGW